MDGDQSTYREYDRAYKGPDGGTRTLAKAQKRGRVLYRAPPGTRYTPLLVVFLILSLALMDYHPIFIGLSVLFRMLQVALIGASPGQVATYAAVLTTSGTTCSR